MPYEARKILSQLRLDNAKEKLNFIPGILELGDYKTVANRSYYAVFDAMRAVLALDGFDSKKHSGIISRFRQEYIKTGVFDDQMSDIITDLFEVRSNSDYDDFFVISKTSVVEQYESAKHFVSVVEKHLEERLK